MTQISNQNPIELSPDADGPGLLRAIRAAFSAVVAEIPDANRPVDLARVLDLDRSLAWKVWRVAQGEDALPSAKHVPGRQGIERFLNAASRVGVPGDLIDAAHAAAQSFGEYAARQAGDRATADIILSEYSTEGRRRLDVALRRAAFRSNGHFLGVQARVLAQIDVIMPGPAGHAPCVARVRGHWGLKRLRAGSAWVVGRTTLMRADGPSPATLRTRLTGEALAPGRAPVLERFSSAAAQDLRRSVSAVHSVEDELAPGPVGTQGEADVVCAELITPTAPRRGGPDAVTMRASTPSELLVFDVLLDRSLLTALGGLGIRSAEAFTTINGDMPYAHPEKRDLLPIAEPMLHMGRADLAPAVGQIPRHGALLAEVFTQLGRSPADFELFRLRMRFPPIPMCLLASYGDA
jgi:hypothetical protein